LKATYEQLDCEDAMKIWIPGILGCALVLLIAAPLQAQTGCTDSPENPTVVLALMGGAGALFSTVRARMRRRRK